MRVIEKPSLMAARPNRSRRASSPVPSETTRARYALHSRRTASHRDLGAKTHERPAPVASTRQDCGAERRIVAPITRTRFQGIPP
jgi:hypothetical protein